MNGMIWFYGVLFAFLENGYFGWNLFPKSPQEVICDGIVLLFFALAMKGTE